MLSQGIHPKVVQERLGHSTIGVTLDVYSYVLPDMQREAAATLDQHLSGWLNPGGCQTARKSPGHRGRGLRFPRLIGVSVGAEGQNRTGDTVIFSHVLYRLSYLGRSLVGDPRSWAIEGSNL